MRKFPEIPVSVSPEKLKQFTEGVKNDLAKSEERARQLRRKAASMSLPGQPDPLNIRFGIPSRIS